MVILISFDIDGTLEFGDPPGGVTLDMVRRAQERGFVIGSCSDRFAQKKLWERHNIKVDFVLAKQKHLLEEVKARFQVEKYIHVGDRDLDRQIAEQAGFEFLWDHEAVSEPWLNWQTQK